MEKQKFNNVDDYIAAQTEAARPILNELREIIKSTVPSVSEGISWGVPFYKFNGMLCGFAAYKHHVHFGVVEYTFSNDLRKTLENRGYTVLQRGVQIQYGQPVPKEEIAIMVAEKAKLNEEKHPEKQA